MPLDPESTRQRIFAAAVEEFAAHGSAGARIDRIATKARANKESIYRYYGTKDELLRRVLDRFLDERGEELLPKTDDLAQYIGDSLGHFAAHPEYVRLTLWEGLELGSDLDPDAVQHRRAHFEDKLDAITAQQRAGHIDPDLDPRHLLLALQGLANYWLAMPQVVRLVLGEEPDADALARHQEFIAECARRILKQPDRKPSPPRKRTKRERR